MLFTKKKSYQVKRADSQLDSALKLPEGIRLASQTLSAIQHILTVPIGQHTNTGNDLLSSPKCLFLNFEKTKVDIFKLMMLKSVTHL